MAASDDLEKLDQEITDVLEKETKESEKVCEPRLDLRLNMMLTCQ
jgi:hypothetical protein